MGLPCYIASFYKKYPVLQQGYNRNPTHSAGERLQMHPNAERLGGMAGDLNYRA